MPKIIDRIAAPTLFQNSQSYITFVFLEWHIRKLFDKVHIWKDCDQEANKNGYWSEISAQFHSDSHEGFLTKSSFEIVMAYFHPLQ